MSNPLFEVGQLVITRRAQQALDDANQSVQEFVSRHVVGDYGSIPDHVRQENQDALDYGDERILSAYTTGKGIGIWVCTEENRESTAVIVEREYGPAW